MKWTVFVGILGLAIGFLVGRAGEGTTVVEGDSSDGVVKSERRVVGSRGERSRGERSRESRGRDGQPAEFDQIAEILRTGYMGEFSGEARLKKWILELESGDFPDVLEELSEIEGANRLDDPFSDDPFAPDEWNLRMLALSRWYELDGDHVLDWVIENEGEGRAKATLVSLIKDGYGRDPKGAFELLVRHAGVLAGEEGLSSSWYFDLGRWSSDLQSDLAALDSLAETHGIQNSPAWDDPFAADVPSAGEMAAESLVLGAMVAGRLDEIRAIYGDQNSEVTSFLRSLDQMEVMGDASE